MVVSLAMAALMGWFAATRSRYERLFAVGALAFGALLIILAIAEGDYFEFVDRQPGPITSNMLLNLALGFAVLLSPMLFAAIAPSLWERASLGKPKIEYDLTVKDWPIVEVSAFVKWWQDKSIAIESFVFDPEGCVILETDIGVAKGNRIVVDDLTLCRRSYCSLRATIDIRNGANPALWLHWRYVGSGQIGSARARPRFVHDGRTERASVIPAPRPPMH